MAKKLTTKHSKPKAAVKNAGVKTAPVAVEACARKPLPNVFRLTKDGIKLLFTNRKIILIVLAFYILFQIILASGLAGSLDITELKVTLEETLAESRLITGLTLYGALLTTIGSASSDAASVYQAVLFVLFSLIFLFVIRHAHAGQSLSVAEAFYKSTAQLIPFLLVLGIIAVQLVPLILANFLYSAVFITGIAVTLIEQLLWGLLIAALVFWTLYLLVASIMALYIVTLPDMRPLQAHRSARQLVRRRRLVVLRKLLFLPLVVVLLMAIIIIPTIIFAAPLTSFIFFLLVSLLLPFSHSYLYNLYRRLL